MENAKSYGNLNLIPHQRFYVLVIPFFVFFFDKLALILFINVIKIIYYLQKLKKISIHKNIERLRR